MADHSPSGLSRSLTIRSARLDDARVLFDWRNDEQTRGNSFDGDEVSWQAHQGWMARSLASPDRLLLIIEFDSEPFGLVRFDRLDARCWEVGVNLAAPARGRRLAAPALELGADVLRAAHPSAERVLARIKGGNMPSLRAFGHAGFLPESTDEAVGGIRRLVLHLARD